MKSILMASMMIMLVNGFIVLILNIITKKTFMDREKSSPFECGFDPLSNTRLPFSLSFFLIAIIFLVFDVEITLLLPMTIVYKTSSLMNFSTVFIVFMTILMLGLFHEWNQGALNWQK